MANESSDKRDTAAPVCYGIVNAAGKLWMSESCIAGDEETLDVELEHAQDSDDTYRVVPLFAEFLGGNSPSEAPESLSTIPHNGHSASESSAKRMERVTTYIKNSERVTVLLTVDGEPTLLEPGRSLEITHAWDAASVPSAIAAPSLTPEELRMLVDFHDNASAGAEAQDYFNAAHYHAQRSDHFQKMRDAIGHAQAPRPEAREGKP